jgi:phosphatidylglycerol lysyltransferase
MRHHPDAPPGVMDFLFASLLEQCQALGYTSFNLGLSALYTGEQPAAPRIEQALHYIYEHVDQFYNFKGLHTFKQKFHPTWSPRYLVYPGPAALPRVSWALSELNAGEGLVHDLWHEMRRFVRRNGWQRLRPDETAKTESG